MTPLNDRIFALGIDAWVSEGRACPAWEGHLSVASAVRFILPSGDRLSVYMCKKPRHSLTSLLQHLQNEVLGQISLSLPGCI